jgi:two-component system nitrate/nitrite response regulator NarL
LELKVAVVDDHPLVWQGLKAVLQTDKDMEPIGWASNGREAEKLILEQKPDVVLMDLRLPGESGLDIVKRLKPRAPSAHFVILTTYAEQQDVTKALNIGVDGYVLKEALPEEMLNALRLVSKGRPYFDPAVMQLVARNRQRENELSLLTERELEVLQELGRGLSNKEIARKLFITEYTVKKHVSGILSKLGLKDRTQAALYAVEQEL